MKKLMRQQGFTLPELLMAIMLVALMAGGGLRSGHAYLQALRLEQHARQLLDFLTRAQAGARWHNHNRTLWVIHAGSGWCLVTGFSPAGGCPSAGGARVFMPDDRRIELAEYTARRFDFYGLRNAAQPGHLTLANPAGRIRLVISVRGRLRLCSERQAILALPRCE
ncbi:prepilin peptidase-dependent protein [Affinibrenneria salicis]|uniref:Prepilin peptidase-dependent protein n=1 Tax=Affinibrenneria salicis TaxID=2590031 RepID=A0A5J5FXC2_9GAMM|nr:prepilin peptidase-dependent protein [Affinibrenneria salicis]KAA8997619.1 prepilin peptidase-dependent protein [Affinibrenneria salicis]